MEKLNVGMVGAGFIGQLAHLANFIEIPDCNVIALAELRPELRHKVALRYGISKTYASHKELLEDSEVDAVVVVTQRPLMGPVVLDCLNAKKHVLSEKPMAGSAIQGKMLVEAAESNKVRYAVGYMKRFDEGVEAAKSLLDRVLQTKELGALMSVHATCYAGNSYCNAYGHVVTQEPNPESTSKWSIAPDWLPTEFHRLFATYLNTYSHVTNLLRYLFEYTPTIDFVNLTEHQGQLAVLRFPGFLATLQTGKMSHHGWSEEVRMTFTDGEINLSLPPALLRNVPASVEIYRAGKIQERIHPCIPWTWAFRRQAESFVFDVLHKRPMRIEASEAYQDILLVETIWEKEMQRLGMLQTV